MRKSAKQTEFAARGGLLQSYLKGLVNGDGQASGDALATIAKALANSGHRLLKRRILA